jgi:hypothetical protein
MLRPRDEIVAPGRVVDITTHPLQGVAYAAMPDHLPHVPLSSRVVQPEASGFTALQYDFFSTGKGGASSWEALEENNSPSEDKPFDVSSIHISTKDDASWMDDEDFDPVAVVSSTLENLWAETTKEDKQQSYGRDLTSPLGFDTTFGTLFDQVGQSTTPRLRSAGHTPLDRSRRTSADFVSPRTSVDYVSPGACVSSSGARVSKSGCASV